MIFFATNEALHSVLDEPGDILHATIGIFAVEPINR